MLKQNWIRGSRPFQLVFWKACTILGATLLITVGAKTNNSNGQRKVMMNDEFSGSVQFSGATKYSYIDRAGKVVIDASKYEGARNFSEGLAAVLDSQKGWGFIDRTGALVISPRFQDVSSFSEGLAAVQLNERWGFINKDGTLVIDHQFTWVGVFSEGVAVVQRPLKSPKAQAPPAAGSHAAVQSVVHEVSALADETTDKGRAGSDEYIVIDTAGKTLAVLDHTKVEVNIDDARFSEGLMCVRSVETDAMGYINKAGKFVIKPKFQEAGPFSEGLARVAVVENDVEKLAFIDQTGEFVIPPRFNTDFDFRHNSKDFSEGLAGLTEGLNPSETKEATFVYIDKSGKIVIVTEFNEAGGFREGLAAFYNQERNRYGFIDRSG
ncbi:MAG TPA: WG repeat-containing protein, partial [Pyrinomonadaceae bacterium]|nr:WG repeat-containing protein [Pyrinomonadaceae bacterium]